MADQHLTGKIKSYDPIQRQGVIIRDDGQGELFVDVFGLNSGEELEIREGVRVRFRLLAHTTGSRAEDVTIYGDDSSAPPLTAREERHLTLCLTIAEMEAMNDVPPHGWTAFGFGHEVERTLMDAIGRVWHGGVLVASSILRAVWLLTSFVPKHGFWSKSLSYWANGRSANFSTLSGLPYVSSMPMAVEAMAALDDDEPGH